MKKIYIVARDRDHRHLLDALGDLGIVHLAPVDPAVAVPDEKTLADIDRLQLALQLLRDVPPAEQAPPTIDPLDAAVETLRIQRDRAELNSRLAELHLLIEKLAIWGDLKLRDFEQLRRANINVRFFSVPTPQLQQIQAECVHVITTLPGKRLLVAVIDRTDAAQLPPQAQPFPLPQRDRDSIRSEAAQIDLTLKQNHRRLNELAHLIPEIRRQLVKMQTHADFTVAARGALAEESLFALQGWAPAEKSENLATLLAAAGVEAAVSTIPPATNEQPPTLIHYPAWSRPIKGLFDILGTLPGYKELDLSPYFMIALPVFAAMLIGDAGYGLIFMLLPIIFYRKITAADKPKINLLITIGAFTFIWGLLSANFFGVSPETIAKAAGFIKTIDAREVADIDAMRRASGLWPAVGKVMITIAPLWDADSEKAREIFIKISLLFGCLHLTLAHLRQALAFFPDLRTLAQIGWCLFLWAMLGIIWLLFFSAKQPPPAPLWLIYTALGLGFALFVLFTAPDKNPAKMIGIGLASSLLPMLATFSDTMSYIRLMAVGLASYYIATAFNSIGATVAPAATWFAAAPIVIFGHALNIALCIIAIFAHGVRLNMLEFSNNAGVQWVGYPYAPFAKRKIKET